MSAEKELPEEVPYVSPIRLFRVDRVNAKPRPLVSSIDGLLLKNSLAGVVGPPSAMKTLLIADMCACLSTGKPWFGRKVRQGPAIILLGESNERVFRRFSALEKLRGISVKGAPLLISNRLDTLLVSAAVRAVGDKIAARCEKEGQSPSMICIDPLAIAMGQGDENSASDMSRIMDNFSEHLRRRFGCTVVVVHHTGHNNTGRARGSAAFRASLDTEIVVARDGLQVRMECTKQKDMQEFSPISLLAQTVVIDSKAEERAQGSGTSLAFVSAKSVETSNKQEAALGCLRKLSGINHKLVPSSEWRSEILGKEIATSQKSFERIKEKLKSSGKIEVVGKNVRVR